MKKLLLDIRVWILFAFLIRLIGITNAPLEIAHNWRQTSVNMIARNYHEGNTAFLYPMLDNAGKKSGITGTEFPLFNYLIAGATKLFGWNHWIGRLINLIISTLGTWVFFLLIKRWINQEVAFTSTIVFLFSLWFAFSRKIMPDTFSVSIAIFSLWFITKLFDTKRLVYLVLFGVFSMMGMLCKIPAATVLAPIAILLFILPNWKLKIQLFITGIIALIPVGFWYGYWFQHLVEIGEFQFYFMGPSLPVAVKQLATHPIETLNNFYRDALKYIGFALFLFGLFKAFKHKQKAILAILISTFLVFVLFILKAGYGFYIHEYYTLPFVPIMALVAGYGITELPSKKWQWVFIVAIVIEGVANQQHDFFIKNSEKYKLEYESIANQFVPKESLVVVNSTQNPQELYFLNRKGSAKSPEFIASHFNELYTLGYDFVLWNKKHGDLNQGLLIYETNEIALFKTQH